MEKLTLFLLLIANILQENALDGQTQKNENMNGEYLIANPNSNNGKKYSTLYPNWPNVKYFDVYSPPISSK